VLMERRCSPSWRARVTRDRGCRRPYGLCTPRRGVFLRPEFQSLPLCSRAKTRKYPHVYCENSLPGWSSESKGETARNRPKPPDDAPDWRATGARLRVPLGGWRAPTPSSPKTATQNLTGEKLERAIWDETLPGVQHEHALHHLRNRGGQVSHSVADARRDDPARHSLAHPPLGCSNPAAGPSPQPIATQATRPACAAPSAGTLDSQEER
jgi:hypothetical protein